jgi:hypothetical protein
MLERTSRFGIVRFRNWSGSKMRCVSTFCSAAAMSEHTAARREG